MSSFLNRLRRHPPEGEEADATASEPDGRESVPAPEPEEGVTAVRPLNSTEGPPRYGRPFRPAEPGAEPEPGEEPTAAEMEPAGEEPIGAEMERAGEERAPVPADAGETSTLPEVTAISERPSARERGRMRRRLRRQRHVREALLLDLGALVFELQRQGRREPELLQAKAAELSAVDDEVRALSDALGSRQPQAELVATGVAGSCERCGSLLGTDDRFCSACGAPAVPSLGGRREQEEPLGEGDWHERLEGEEALAQPGELGPGEEEPEGSRNADGGAPPAGAPLGQARETLRSGMARSRRLLGRDRERDEEGEG